MRALFVLLIALSAGNLKAQAPLPENAGIAPGANPVLEKSRADLAKRLPELAIRRLEQFLSTEPPKEERVSAKALLLEAYVRMGFDQGAGCAASDVAAKAVKLASDSSLKEDPNTLFWEAQAHALREDFKEAESLLGTIEAAHGGDHVAEAALTRSNILLNLDDRENALAVLQSMINAEDPDISYRARTKAAAIALSLKRFRETEELLQFTVPDDEAKRQRVNFLRARLALESNQLDRAKTLFRELVNAGPELRMPHAEASIIGLAKTLNQKGDATAADTLLVKYVDRTKKSRLLPAAFETFRATGFLNSPDNINHLLRWSEGDGSSERAVQAHYYLGLAYMRQNEEAKAIEALDAFARKYPDAALHQFALLRLAMLYVDQKDSDRTRETLIMLQ
ncbi:MAG: tetratricopeptide repeat protein [Verrucomicrobiota bacterium]